MQDQPSPEIKLLHAAYAAFNTRNMDAALALMTPDVAWPKGNWGQIPIPIMQKSSGLPQLSHQLLARVALGFATDDTHSATFL